MPLTKELIASIVLSVALLVNPAATFAQDVDAMNDKDFKAYFDRRLKKAETMPASFGSDCKSLAVLLATQMIARNWEESKTETKWVEPRLDRVHKCMDAYLAELKKTN